MLSPETRYIISLEYIGYPRHIPFICVFAAEAEIRPQPKSLEAAPHELLTVFSAFNSFRGNQIAIHTEIGSLRTLFIWGASYYIFVIPWTLQVGDKC